VECARREIWNILEIRFQFVSSATVANRYLKIQIYGPDFTQAATIIMHNIFWTTPVVASQTMGVFCFQGAPANNEVITPPAGTDGLIPHFHAVLPSPCLIRGNMDTPPDKVVLSVNGIQVDDQISAFHLKVIRGNQFDEGYK
jgi:hypothetical protein